MGFIETDDSWPMHRDPKTPLLPPPRYDALRDLPDPALITMYDGNPAVVLTKYDDIRSLLMAENVSSDGRLPRFPYVSDSARAGRGARITIDRLDSPVHDEQRSMLAGTFSIKRIRELRPFIEHAVDGLLDDLERERGAADFRKVVAERLPAIVICQVLQLPPEDAPFLRQLVGRFENDAADPEDIKLATKDMMAYYGNIVDGRMDSEGTDLISNLIRNQLIPGKLTREQLLMTCHLLTTAGFDTTTNAISLGVIALLQNRDDWDEIVNDHDGEVVRVATEELIRFLSPAHANHLRLTTAEVPIGHSIIPADHAVIAVQAAGNHDPAQFPDPHRLDIHRDARGHLGFSMGLHQCLGQQLARLELHVVFEKLPKRFPDLRIAIPMEDLPFRPNHQVYGVKELPVEWGEKAHV
jgi:cytochrome P450